eukprot:Skav235497  [mRNA]  locus=scaffold153:207137:211276:+ [translate_table: standard]
MALPGMLPDPRAIAEWPGAVPRPGEKVCAEGRRFIPDGYGETHQWRPCKRQLSEPGTVVRENGIRAADQPAREVDVTVEMQRKARNEELDMKRNGIGCRALGDKNYRHPEYMSRFFHSGELIFFVKEAEAEVEDLTLRWEADTLKDHQFPAAGHLVVLLAYWNSWPCPKCTVRSVMKPMWSQLIQMKNFQKQSLRAEGITLRSLGFKLND